MRFSRFCDAAPARFFPEIFGIKLNLQKNAARRRPHCQSAKRRSGSKAADELATAAICSIRAQCNDAYWPRSFVASTRRIFAQTFFGI